MHTYIQNACAEEKYNVLHTHATSTARTEAQGWRARGALRGPYAGGGGRANLHKSKEIHKQHRQYTHYTSIQSVGLSVCLSICLRFQRKAMNLDRHSLNMLTICMRMAVRGARDPSARFFSTKCAYRKRAIWLVVSTGIACTIQAPHTHA